jgi:fructokinase
MISNKIHVLSCGEVLWDVFPDGACFGGAPANFACHAAILGCQTSMLSAVGRDSRGDQAIEILQRIAVDTSLIQRVDDAPTGSVSVRLDAAGKPSFEIHPDSAWDHVAWSPSLESCVSNVDAIYFGTLGQRSHRSRATIRRAMMQARDLGILRVLDVNLRQPFYDRTLIRESIEQANVLKLSDEELVEVCVACGISSSNETNHPTENPTGFQSQMLLSQLRETQSLDIVVMTRGANGAVLASSNGILEQPGIPTRVVDTVGAGDAFTAAFVHGILCGDSHEQILFEACSIASQVCSHAGAVPN